MKLRNEQFAGQKMNIAGKVVEVDKDGYIEVDPSVAKALKTAGFRAVFSKAAAKVDEKKKEAKKPEPKKEEVKKEEPKVEPKRMAKKSDKTKKKSR
jgi:hypothetical protein